MILVLLTLLLSISPAMADPLQGSVEQSSMSSRIMRPAPDTSSPGPNLEQGNAAHSQYSGLIDTSAFSSAPLQPKLDRPVQQPFGGYASDAPQTDVNPDKSSRWFHLKDNHGQQLFGVVGFEVDHDSGRVQRICPESHINDFSIKVGDYLVGVAGRPYSADWLRTVRPGDIGEPLELTFRRHDPQDGSLFVTKMVPRIDSRLVQQYPCSDGYFAQQAARTRSW